ncbi:MAG: tetratricopeptide repeat protein [Bacteroidota bacterium]
MNKFLYITIFVAIAANGALSQEERMKEEGVDDLEALSSKNFPYIERFHEAVREQMAGNLEEAVSLYKACLEEKEDDAAYFALGQIAEKRENYQKAREYYENALNLDPENITYVQSLAFTMMEQADFEEAEPLFEQLTDREPRNIEWHYAYARVLIYNKKYEVAIKRLNSLQEQVGIIPEMMIMKADLYQEIKATEKAESTLLKLKEAHPTHGEGLEALLSFYKKQEEEEKVEQLLERMAAQQPDNIVVQTQLADYYVEHEQFDKLRTVVDRLAGHSRITTQEKLNWIKALAGKEELSEDYLLELSNKILEANEDDARATLFHAEILTKNRRSREALPFYRKALKLSPETFEVWMNVLSFESAYRDYEALYQDATEAMTRFPNMPFVYYAAAGGAIYTDRLDEAEELISAGELYVLEDPVLKARFAMRRGELHFMKKEFKKGITAFEKALSEKPLDIIRLRYAGLLAKNGIALSVAKEQIDLVNPEGENDPAYYRTKAQYLLAKKKYDDAITLLKRGIENIDYTAELHDFLGDIYWMKQERAADLAIKHWKLAKEKHSRNTNIDKKLKEEKFYAPKYY